jgi:chemotaxis protein MotB
MAWLLTFADLVSLLITFFVMIYATRTLDDATFKKLQGSLAESLASAKVPDKDKFRSTKDIETIDLVPTDNLDYIQGLLKTRFESDPVLGSSELRVDPATGTLTIAMPNRLLFETGASALLPRGQEAMQRLGDILRHLDNPIVVHGHTDPAPTQSAALPTNWELSLLRALGVVKQLHAGGVSQSLRASGFADSRFDTLDPRLTEPERYQRARRVEIIILEKKG